MLAGWCLLHQGRVRTAVQSATSDPGREELAYRPEIDATVIWELFAAERWAQYCDSPAGAAEQQTASSH